ncbi:MAG: aminotransferase class IV [Candidatus Micrarchaeota archaeon]|nr:aminotransferase class IV [Candidatus Micrarchaeota archaeon]MCX8154737.1 aminotransferase class IV [Candidatus Micrarchaeota archaeon]
MIFSPDLGRFAETFNISPFSHSINYGDAIFEGMSIVVGNRISLFHPELNYERMQYGADHMRYGYRIDVVRAINTVFYLYLMNAYTSKRVYVRPVLYRDNNSVGLRNTGVTRLMHVLMPMEEYVEGDMLRVKVSNIPRELPFARIKASSNYQLSLYALRDAEGYDEVVFLDKQGKIVEGSGENILFLKDNTLYTDRYHSLPGITLRFVVKIAKEMGIDMKYGSFSLEEINDVDLIMFTGNAIGIKLVSQINYNGSVYQPKMDSKDVYMKIKNRYNNIFYGQDEQYHMFLDEFVDVDKYNSGIVELDRKPERYERVVRENIQELGLKRFL